MCDKLENYANMSDSNQIKILMVNLYLILL
jgi:hypothetical protein